MTEPVCRDSDLEILYADEAIVAIQKPAGLLVHRTRLDVTATGFAMQRLRNQLGRSVYPAHRIDRATSGVLLFALAPDIAARLGAAFEAGDVNKRYLAIVRGWPTSGVTIDHPLTRLADDVHPGTPTPPPQSAITEVDCLATAEVEVRVDRYPVSRYALVEARPLTGRRHQLRRHLRHIHHPIVGDTTYGQGRHNRLFRERFGSWRLLLHAERMTLPHPLSGIPLTIVAPPPPDFVAVTDSLGLTILSPSPTT